MRYTSLQRAVRPVHGRACRDENNVHVRMCVERYNVRYAQHIVQSCRHHCASVHDPLG